MPTIMPTSHGSAASTLQCAKPKQFPVDASGRGDDRRQEGVTQAWSRLALPILINLRLCPLRGRKVEVLMAQGAILSHIQRGVISAAMEVVNCGDVHGDTTESVHAHFGSIHDTPGDGAIASLAEENQLCH